MYRWIHRVSNGVDYGGCIVAQDANGDNRRYVCEAQTPELAKRIIARLTVEAGYFATSGGPGAELAAEAHNAGNA